MIRVLIADDQLVIRSGFKLFLRDEPDIEVVGEASSGLEAVRKARDLNADVVLMDIRMPGGDGITATRELTGPGVADPIAVIIVTTFDLDEYIFGALESGAAGFLLKDADPDALAWAVRAAARGDGLVSPSVTRRVITEFARRQRPKALDVLRSPDLLTSRELDIVRALARGMSNQEIADQLHLEVGTVKTHLNRITTKLDLRGRVQIVVWAFQQNLPGIWEVPVASDWYTQ
ncbi:response regulator [Devriesea agamarum]|uniref:response regulator n=1 Tax=Devriesea agamarum TaxID=472569 RepID=UPI00071C3097|nr:response regulator transcription factor [Devriesea agamarum]